MSLTLLPDVERMLSVFLLDQPEIAALVDDRVYTALPKAKDWPMLRLTRIAGAPRFNRPLHLDAALIQFDAWADRKVEALELAETTRAVLADRAVGVREGGVITGVDFGELLWLPDTDFSTAKPRYLFTVTVYAHPGGDDYGS